MTTMNVQLANTISDVSGVTGLAIIRAIVKGERDPWVLASVGALVVASASLAALLPVRRALRLDPMTALRAE